MRKPIFLPLAFTVCLLACPLARAQLLYPEFLEPGFIGEANTEFSSWDIFYSPHTAPNYPDQFAPNGSSIARSAAGFPANPVYSPSDPLAFWNTSNPTITQTVTGANAPFIVGPGATGNIYSFAHTMNFVLQDTTPYTAGTVVFQFQTAGEVMDFNSIELVYDNGGGEVALKPSEMIKEFGGSGSDRGGIGNRTAVQWDLTSLGITSYEIRFNAADASLSFQRALLDTAQNYEAVVPQKRAWDAEGADANWSNSANWSANSAPAAGANVTFAAGNSAHLDGNQMVGELIFAKEGGFEITGAGSSALTINTGITANPGTASSYTIHTPIVQGGLHYHVINENATVTLSGPIRAGDYGGTDGAVIGGFVKEGKGTLIIDGNIESSVAGGIGMQDGTLVLRGTNAFTGTIYVDGGTLVIGNNALINQPGALGVSSSIIDVGMDLTGSPIVLPAEARILIDGAYQVARAFSVNGGNEIAIFGGRNTGAGATFSGNISLAASNLAGVYAEAASDRVSFTAGISGGAADKTLTKTGAGTVVFSGTNKTYANATVITAGTLEIASGTAVTGNGAWTVQQGGELRVNGTLSGNGALSLEQGRLSGTGTIQKQVILDMGDRIAPGNSTGKLTLGSGLVLGANGGYVWEISNATGTAGNASGWDLLDVTGAISVTASAANPFTIYITSITLEGAAGLPANFDPQQEYSWRIASAGAIGGFAEDLFVLDASAAFDGVFGLEREGSDLFLTYAPVPEPAAWALLAAAGLFVLMRARRRA